VDSWSLQASSSPAPRAQATAALIGDTWLTTTTSLSARAPDPGWAKSSSQARRTRPPTSAKVSPSGGSEPGIGPPVAPDLDGDGAHRFAFELAVVDLDPALVDLDW
jgi:hypothetical protein